MIELKLNHNIALFLQFFVPMIVYYLLKNCINHLYFFLLEHSTEFINSFIGWMYTENIIHKQNGILFSY